MSLSLLHGADCLYKRTTYHVVLGVLGLYKVFFFYSRVSGDSIVEHATSKRGHFLNNLVSRESRRYTPFDSSTYGWDAQCRNRFVVIVANEIQLASASSGPFRTTVRRKNAQVRHDVDMVCVTRYVPATSQQARQALIMAKA